MRKTTYGIVHWRHPTIHPSFSASISPPTATLVMASSHHPSLLLYSPPFLRITCSAPSEPVSPSFSQLHSSALYFPPSFPAPKRLSPSCLIIACSQKVDAIPHSRPCIVLEGHTNAPTGLLLAFLVPRCHLTSQGSLRRIPSWMEQRCLEVS